MQNLEDEFAFLDDWEDRYRHVIEMGKAMPCLPAELKNETNKIQGCVSQVWLIAVQDSDGRFGFSGDSDAHIVRGLVALLLVLIDGKTKQQIQKTDITGFFTRIGLADNLSPQRANGLLSMIERVSHMVKT